MKITGIIGLLLILYAIFLTPCYLEPSDIIISTAYIIGFMAMGFPIWILILWIISGYIALVIGIILVVHFAISVKHPVVIGGVLTAVAVLIGYYLIFVNGLLII